MIKRFLGVLFCALVLFSCASDEPEGLSGLAEACFSIEAGAKAGTPISFNSSCSKNAATFAWNFGDGTTSTEAAPIHTYVSKGSYEVTLSITSLGGATDEFKKTIEVADVPASAIISHFGDVNTDQVWEPGIHKIFGWVNIKDATVTIKPGAIIKFMEGAKLAVGTANGVTRATLIAEGTASQPIVFTADSDTPTKGFWDNIVFGSGGSGNSSLAYCRIEYGGPGVYESMVAVYGTSVSIQHCKFQQVSGNGISLGNSGSFKAFSNNEIRDCSGYVMEIAPNRVPQIGLNNNFLTTKGILLGVDEITEQNVVWKKQTCPYIVSGTLEISDTEGASLTIDPGVTVKFNYDAVMTVGYSASSTGKLIAEGTETQPIIFTSAQETPAAADWDGIRFSAGTDPASSLKNCVIEYAYGGTNTSVYASIIVGGGVNINNTIIRHTKGTAIQCVKAGNFISFENNTIQGTTEGIRIYGNWVHTIGNTNQITATKEIIVEADKIIHSAVTWKKQPYPYHVTGLVEIVSAAGSTLTIEPGNTIKFGGGASIWASSSYGQGHLIAHGTATELIIFTSGKPTPAPGDFGSILLTGHSSMRYCVVEYSGYDNWYGGIRITSDQAAVRNCTIKNSSNYGITTQRATPILENNDFINNAQQDYYHTL